MAESLFRLATGYAHDAAKIFLHEDKPMVVPYTKCYPPNATVAIFWLKHRQPAKWR